MPNVERLLDALVWRHIEEGLRTGGECPSGEEDHARGLFLCHAKQRRVQVHACHLRHHQIAQDHVEALSGGDAPECLARAPENDDVVFGGQGPLNRRRDHRLVVDHQDPAAPSGGNIEGE